MTQLIEVQKWVDCPFKVDGILLKDCMYCNSFVGLDHKRVICIAEEKDGL